jgi:signal transduction histidine kinase/DNA-binding response OmpR family regulator
MTESGNRELRVLILEDSENDALLLDLALKRAGYRTHYRRVDSEAAMEAALLQQAWDVVIADYIMPGFDGLSALGLMKRVGLDLPFIIVSGHISDDTAVAAMKAGAHDYVMKDNLARLGPAVERELREAQVRREQRRSEERLKTEHAITRLLAGAATLEEAARGVVDVILQTLQMDAGTLWSTDAQPPALRPLHVGARRETPPLAAFVAGTRCLKLPRGAGYPGRVWQTLQPLWIDNLSACEDFERIQPARAAGLNTYIAFPLQTGAGWFGVIEFAGAKITPEDALLQNMLSAITSELAQFAQRRAAEEALRRAHEELELRVRQRTADLQIANARLQAAIAERRRLEQELLEITEQERRRIGLDLHDDLGQRLSGLGLMTKGLALRLEKSGAPEAEDAARIHALVQETMNRTSDLAHDLATLELGEKPLPAALAELAARARELFQIHCEVKTAPNLPPLEPGSVQQLCKIAQEALTNAIKHGQATRVRITLSQSGQNLSLRVENNGRPFPDLSTPAGGMGLRIMNYRAHLLGGTVTITGGKSGGTSLTCVVPLEKPSDSPGETSGTTRPDLQ